MSFPRTPETSLPTEAHDPIPLLLRDLVLERTGTHFDSERIGLMLDKLEPRLKATGSSSFLEYFYLLKYDDKGPQEWRRVMDAFSVQETYFWRELDQIRALVERVIPAWFAQTTRPFRIWSAACASGEEPYSIVIALLEAGLGHYPIEIVASDASEAALEKARTAIYRERSFRALPAGLREKYFVPHPDGSLLRPEVSSRVVFQWANLVALDESTTVPQAEVIFCRNVFIYFSPATIRKVVTAFAKRVPAKGQLFVGASESLLKLTDQFELQELADAFVYERTATS
ncbi:MAG TPA: protein-glutamate O-methyltransferase CheR [Lacunisphaera sp.]|jgi:chemotaxis protein methyltransferase CheR